MPHDPPATPADAGAAPHRHEHAETAAPHDHAATEAPHGPAAAGPGHDHAPAHPHGSGHHHLGHGHHHGADGTSGFAPGIALNLGFTALEVAAGLLAGSVALLADAGHNLSDVLGLVLGWGAARLAQRAPSARRTYGWHRASILAALANALLLLVAVGAILLEAAQRLLAPEPVATGPMLWVAAIGVLINGGTALLFARGRAEDLNRRGAFLHMAADAGVSLAVVLGALLIQATGWLWVDPALGLLVAVVILLGTWGLLREALDLAMDAVPPGIDLAAIEAALRAAPGVVAVHDLHVWPLGTTRVALTAHLVLADAVGPQDALLARLAAEIAERFGIRQTTLQLECGDPAHPCRAGLA
jgi:cobalt-zinc-cadmium efflux system protein